MSQNISIDLIDPDPNQPRKHFDPGALEQLAQSIQETGLAVPISVRPVDDRYIIIHGERRYRAAKLLGWKSIQADVREVNSDSARWLALVENVQRNDLTPIEEAEAYKERLTEGITQDEMGKRIGKTQSYIAQKLRLLTLPGPVRFYLSRGAITEGHARQLLKLKAIYTEDLIADYSDLAEERLFEKLPEVEAWRLLSFGMLKEVKPEESPICIFYHSIPEKTDWATIDEVIARVPFYLTPIDDEALRRKIYLLAEGCMQFDRYLCETGGRIPQWCVGAFWWASVVIDYDLNVYDLGRHLDRWKDRFYTAVFWGGIPRGQKPSYKLSQLERWGYMADLRHSNVDIDNVPQQLRLNAARAMNLDHRIAPSNCQPWGFNTEEYQRLVNARKIDY